MRFCWILFCLCSFGVTGQPEPRIFPFELNQEDSSQFVSGFCIPFWSPLLRPEHCIRCQCSFLFFQWRCFRTCASSGTTTTTNQPSSTATNGPIPVSQITPRPGGSTEVPFSQESDEGDTISPVVGNRRRKRKGPARLDRILETNNL